MLAGVMAVIISSAVGGPDWLPARTFGLASFDPSALADGGPVAQVTTTTMVGGPPVRVTPPLVTTDL